MITYVKVSRRVTNGVPNAKKLITRPIMVVTSPKSSGMDFSHPIFRFEIFETQLNPHHGQNCLYVLKVGRFSCPVKKVTPKYGSTVKNFRLESWPKIFLWPSIHVGCMPFHFRQNFQLKIFHRQRHRHRHPCPVHFCKNEKVEEKNYLKIEKFKFKKEKN